jgi:large repetitive protein
VAARLLSRVVLVLSACGGGDAPPGQPDAAVGPAPETDLTEGPADVTRATTATFVFVASAPGAGFECSLDGAPFAACVSPLSVAVAEGEHAFAVRAHAGGATDPTPARRSWRVDVTPPETTIESGPSELMDSSEARFVFSASEDAAFECSLDGAPPTVCESGVELAELALGPHLFSVHAIDLAANVDPEPARWTWTVMRRTPNTRITRAPDSPWRDATVELEFASDVEGARFECGLNQLSPRPCASPVRYDLDEGEWAFEVVAIDADGLRDPTPARILFVIRFPFW